MTLDNLLGIGRLKAHKPSRVEVSRLVASARECAEPAAQLIAEVRAWLKKNRPDLL